MLDWDEPSAAELAEDDWEWQERQAARFEAQDETDRVHPFRLTEEPF